MSKGHVYHYFSDKHAIVVATIEAVLNAHVERVRRHVRQTASIDALTERLQAAVAFGPERDRSLYFDILAEAGRNADVYALLRAYSERIRGIVADGLRNVQGRHQIDRNVDVDAAASMMVAVGESVELVAFADPGSHKIERAAFSRRMLTALLAMASE